MLGRLWPDRLPNRHISIYKFILFMINRAHLYQLMARQLHDDGNYLASTLFQRSTATPLPHLPADSPSLLQLVNHSLGSTRGVNEVQGFLGSIGSITDAHQHSLDSSLAGSRAGASQAAGFYDPNMLHHFSVRHEGKYQDKATFSKFSGDGKYLISGAADACLKLVNVSIAVLSGQALKEKYRRTYYGHFGTVTDASFHPYAHVVASCSKDSTIRLYSTQPKDVVPRDMLETFDLATGLTSVAWNPCGTILAAASGSDSQIRLLDINKYERGAGMPVTNPVSGASSISTIGFNSQLVSASLMWATYGGGIVFYDIRSGKNLADLHGTSRAAAQGVSFKGSRRNVSAHFLGDGYRYLLSSDDPCELYDIRDASRPVCVFPDIRQCATTMWNDTIVVGLNAEQRPKAVGCFLSRPGPATILDTKYNLSHCSGHPTEPIFAFVYDKTVHISYCGRDAGQR